MKTTVGIIICSAVALVLAGLVWARHADVIHDGYLLPQCIWSVAGLVAAGVASQVRYRFWGQWAAVLLSVSITLFALKLFARVVPVEHLPESPQMFRLPRCEFPPSELAKFSVVVWLAAVRWDRSDLRRRHLRTAVCGVSLGVLMCLSMANQDPVDAGIIGVLGCLFLTRSGTKSLGLAISAALGLGYACMWRLIRIQLPAIHGECARNVLADGFGRWFVLDALALTVGLALAGYIVSFRTTDPFGRKLGTGLTTLIALQTLFGLYLVLCHLPLYVGASPLHHSIGPVLFASLFQVGILVNIGREAGADSTTASFAPDSAGVM